MAASQLLKTPWSVALLMLALGCAPASSVPAPSAAESSPAAGVAIPLGGSPAAAPGEQKSWTGTFESTNVDPRTVELPTLEPVGDADAPTSAANDYWEAISIQNQSVGYGHTVISNVAVAGRGDCVRTRQNSLLTMVREGQPIEQRIQLLTIETASGELISFQTDLQSGGGEITARGVVVGEELVIATTTAGKESLQVIPWKNSYRGFFAIEQSLTAKPMQLGESRGITALLPMMHSAGETQLTAKDYEIIEIEPGKPQRLLKVRSVLNIGGQSMESLLWCDEAGEVLKTFIPGVEQVGVRTTKELALAKSDAPPLDLIAASIVPLHSDEMISARTERVKYRAVVRNGEIAGVFAYCLSQHVRVIDAKTAKLEVISVRPGYPADPGRQTQPTDDDRQPNSLVQSDDKRVIELAQSIASTETDAAALAVALEQLVHDAIQKKNFSQAFATAAEVAENLEGDCTEHAALLAAVCRARGLPARVAFGLVYYPPRNGFAFHMWNEVWIGDRWLPLDATLGLGGIGADHIKLADSNLKGASAYSAMLPVLQVFGRLELEVVEVE